MTTEHEQQQNIDRLERNDRLRLLALLEGAEAVARSYRGRGDDRRADRAGARARAIAVTFSRAAVD